MLQTDVETTTFPLRIRLFFHSIFGILLGMKLSNVVYFPSFIKRERRGVGGERGREREFLPEKINVHLWFYITALLHNHYLS